MFSRIENRVSRLEFRVSSFEMLEEFFEKTIENRDRKRFISRICNNRNKQYRASCGILYANFIHCIDVQIVGLELKCFIAIIQHSLHRKNNTRTNQPNFYAACEREMIFPDISNSFQFQRAQISTCLPSANCLSDLLSKLLSC